MEFRGIWSAPWDDYHLLPIIIFVAVFEKQIMDGIMAGGVKA